ncbi:MAG: hypothetical protein QOH73_576 [Gaiellaceae bacterium]|nr:hypothetical protein [Gaiellaceae bacterium]
MPTGEPTFPLISRKRGIGISGGTRTSSHRGSGYEIASSRLYRRGDSMRSIDWAASARLSSARDQDEFVVRDTFAEESPRAVVFADRRPGMALYPAELPWLHKPAAVMAAGRLIVASALAARGLAGYLDLADGRPHWIPPRNREDAVRIRERDLRRAAFTAPSDNLRRGLHHLERARHDLPSGSFVFVLSDFLRCPPEPAWRGALSHGWDVVPVIVQDPRWEQSFPQAAGMALPVHDQESGAALLVRLTRREVAARGQANERRLAELRRLFTSLDLDPVVLSTEDPKPMLGAFLAWAERRRRRLRRAS